MSLDVVLGFLQQPVWFDARLNTARRGSVRVRDAEISYRVTPGVEKTLVLVHGGQANSRWWDATVAALGPQAPRTVAMDLSGHGESTWRSEYSAEIWLEEMSAVIEKEAQDGCALVGHSLGGGLSLRLAVTGHPLVSSVVSVDAAPGGPRRRPSAGRKASAVTFPSRAAAVEAFLARKRAWPPWLASYVAVSSVRDDGAGWRWKHDESVRGVDPSRGAPDGPWQCAVTVVVGEKSPITPKNDDTWWSQWSAGEKFERIELPGVGHDIMMEDPVNFSRVLGRICKMGAPGNAA